MPKSIVVGSVQKQWVSIGTHSVLGVCAMGGVCAFFVPLFGGPSPTVSNSTAYFNTLLFSQTAKQ